MSSTTAIHEKQVNDKSTSIVMQKPTVQHSGKQMMRRKNKTKLSFHDQTYKSVNDSPHETLSEHPVCMKLSPQVGKRHQSRCVTTRVGSVTLKGACADVSKFLRAVHGTIVNPLAEGTVANQQQSVDPSLQKTLCL